MFTSGAAYDKVISTKMVYVGTMSAGRPCNPRRMLPRSQPTRLSTKKASLKYSDTMNKINVMLEAKDLPGEEREAISHCREKYREASSQMASGADHLSSCDFRHTRQEFMDALTAVRSCLDRLHDSFQSLPLYALVEADFAVTGVARDLEALTNSGW
ncbi:hypothetical protein HU200_051106 [Digitaria exilis]|uniref:Pectinesterase inhibitor domain-containing protein n=1 Tax=Digitaria exilis TaxID=1010633 RepID=A0A835AQM3_9POAL|nr:hypothetical protein HU200_051106 [Digitaria exilis]